MPIFGLSTESWSAIGTIATTVGMILTAFGTVATALGVWYTRKSLIRSEEEAKTEFEDKIWQEYRSIVQNLPVGVMLGEDLAPEELDKYLKWFFAYFDLTNSQIFIRRKDRIRLETWIEWCDGIRDNFQQPAFKSAWNRIKTKAVENGTLNELRALEADGFSGDPKGWSFDRAVIGKEPSVESSLVNP